MHSLQRGLPWCSFLPGSVFRFVTGKHPLRSAFMLAAAFCAALTSTSVAAADIAQATQNYPSKAIRLIVPDSAGGSPDVMARLIANELTKQMGQQVVVDNRPGASGIIGFEALAKAPADGYTFGFSTFSFITNPSLYATLPYDPVKDFQPLVHSNSSTFLLTVSPALPVKSTQELIDYARAQPGKLSSGHNGLRQRHLPVGARSYPGADRRARRLAAGRGAGGADAG